MSRPADIPRKLANFDAVIRYVRDARAALDKAVGDLDHEPTGDALGYATEMMTGLDTTLITLEHLSRTLQAASNQAASKPRPKPLLDVCPDCELALLPEGRHEHECGGGRNAYHPDDLEDLVGFDGFRVRYPDGAAKQDHHESPSDGPDAEIQANEAAAEPDPKLTRYEECRTCDWVFECAAPHFCDYHGNKFSREQLAEKHRNDGGYALYTKERRWVTVETAKAPPLDPLGPRPEPIAPAPAPHGMRDGSKIHKICVATLTLLEKNGEMDIDEMLESVSQIPGLFSGVKKPRAYFANKLSAFRSKRLVLSDNRGNYRLPNGKAAG